MTTPAKRSEFLFLYDAKMSNPNGDPDENRPRIDPYSGRNLVTDYRLKRTIRDYLKSQGKKIFMRVDLKSDNNIKTIEELAEEFITSEKVKSGKKAETIKKVDKEKLIKSHIDVRLFGLLFAVGSISFKSIGPVQFSIGQSLNKVQELEIRNTRVVPTKEEAKAGTFGHKNILRYSLILFNGFLNQVPAREVGLSEEDIEDMMIAAWHGTNNLSTTSKYGQISRLLARINYSDEKAYIGDIARGISIAKKEGVEDISEVGLDISGFLSTLSTNKSKIEEVQFAVHNALSLLDGSNAKQFLVNYLSGNKIKYRDILAS